MVSTYHCLCNELVFAIKAPLDALPKRVSDNAFICEVSNAQASDPAMCTYTDSVSFDAAPVILELSDGFEKRYLAKCRRCSLTLGYQLDLSQFEDHKAETGRHADLLYIIPGGLIDTEAVSQGRNLAESEAIVPTRSQRAATVSI